MQDFSRDAQDGEELAASGILPPGPEATEKERLQAILEETEREKAQFKALAQRAQADLINYRKRADEDRQELVGNAGAQVILRCCRYWTTWNAPSLKPPPRPHKRKAAGWRGFASLSES